MIWAEAFATILTFPFWAAELSLFPFGGDELSLFPSYIGERMDGGRAADGRQEGSGRAAEGRRGAGREESF